ncbi:alpha-ketoglutarate-dependent dioxygenase AlkB [Sphingomonas sanxanigenens]|nr:alpha-ketoglutarate-dependent dioxygenase AlkB [Sphingomonas sanxanigenens]
MDSIEWDERMSSRRTASFGVAYNYSQMQYPSAPMPPPLEALCDKLRSELGFRPNNCLASHYVDGTSSMGFHSDDTAKLASGTGVGIVSLGANRHIIFRNKADSSIELSYELPAGSLLYMPGAMQREWLHAIPKTPSTGGRISLTFRLLI